MAFRYKMFGYQVESDIKLDFEESVIDNVDIRIIKSKETYIYPFDEEQKWEVYNDDSHSELIFYDAGRFVLETGRIMFTPLESYDERAVILYITGFLFGIYLLMHDRCGIHGSVVNINQKAYIFSGESGAGKSSIARGFIKKGYTLLSDDIALLDEEGLMVIPSFPSQKLWEDTAAIFNIETDQKMKTCLDDEKFYISIENAFYSEPLPLGGIFIIEIGGESVEFSELTSSDKLSYLLLNTYLDYMMEDFDKKLLHFKFATRLSSQIPVYRIRRKAGLNTVDQQIDYVLDELE